MKQLIVLTMSLSLTACSMHGYQSSEELVTNFTDSKEFIFDGKFSDVLPSIVSAAEFCTDEHEKLISEMFGPGMASEHVIKTDHLTESSARLEIWSHHPFKTYLFEVMDVKGETNKTIVTHYQLASVHTGNPVRIEDISSWFNSKDIKCE